MYRPARGRSPPLARGNRLEEVEEVEEVEEEVAILTPRTTAARTTGTIRRSLLREARTRPQIRPNA
jgi:uncharacterized protein YceH (UPF0502 family)